MELNEWIASKPAWIMFYVCLGVESNRRGRKANPDRKRPPGPSSNAHSI